MNNQQETRSRIPKEELERYKLKGETGEEPQSVSFTLSEDIKGVLRPTVEEMESIKAELEPVRAEAEKVITELIDRLSIEYKIFIQVDNREKPFVNFIFPSSNLVY
jgi:hypothetical protein